MLKHIWMVERQIVLGDFMPVHFEYRKSDAQAARRQYQTSKYIKTRIRKYIPAVDNGEGGENG